MRITNPRIVVGMSLFTVAAHTVLFADGARIDAWIAEDAWIESGGALGLFVTSACFFACGWLHARSEVMGPSSKWLVASYLALGGVFLFGGGEELGWGERLHGVWAHTAYPGVSPPRETNLHDLPFLSGWFDVDRLFNLFTFAFVAAVPLAVHSSTWVRRRVVGVLPVVPLAFAVPFGVNQVCSKLAQPLVASEWNATQPLAHAATELEEAVVSVLFACVGVWMLRKALAGRISVGGAVRVRARRD